MTIPSWKSGVTEIGDGIFAYIRDGVGWDICNSGFIVGDEGVLVVDAMMVGGMVRPYIEEIKKITNKPIQYVVDTHHHVDHSFGNQFYLPAEIVGHKGCREQMLSKGADSAALTKQWPHYEQDWLDVELTPPSITYTDKMTIHLGNRSVDLIHPGPAHTFGDTLVHIPDDKILFTGDVAFQYLIPLARDGHISNWIRVIRKIIDNLDINTIVTGHGPVAGKEMIGETLRYLRMLRKTCRAHFRSGSTTKDTAAAIPTRDFQDWEEPWRHLVNVERMFQELRGDLTKERKS